jgi:Ran GTPase-activating protein (RanGAP) involved in mRNA processing and transport
VVATVLRACPSLQELNLEFYVNIGDTGAKELAVGLRGCPNLTSLSLVDAEIGDIGAVALADSLQTCPRLQRFDLADNAIGKANVSILNDVLGANAVQLAEERQGEERKTRAVTSPQPDMTTRWRNVL